MDSYDNNSQKGMWLTSNKFLGFFGALFVLIFITAMIMINILTQVEDIEEKLQYMPPQADGTVISADAAVTGQTIYVPAYSHIYSEGGKPLLLETTLSVRNTDPEREITIRSVEYYGTNGRLVESHLTNPLALGPLATAEFLVEKKEIAGGSGANFIVRWDSATSVTQPLIEAVMIGSKDAGISFARPGVVIE